MKRWWARVVDGYYRVETFFLFLYCWPLCRLFFNLPQSPRGEEAGEVARKDQSNGNSTLNSGS